MVEPAEQLRRSTCFRKKPERFGFSSPRVTFLTGGECGETSLLSPSLEIFAYIVLTFNKEQIATELKLISALKRSCCFLLLAVMC